MNPKKNAFIQNYIHSYWYLNKNISLPKNVSCSFNHEKFLIKNVDIKKQKR